MQFCHVASDRTVVLRNDRASQISGNKRDLHTHLAAIWY